MAFRRPQLNARRIKEEQIATVFEEGEQLSKRHVKKPYQLISFLVEAALS